jgi:hypothetical protein
MQNAPTNASRRIICRPQKIKKKQHNLWPVIGSIIFVINDTPCGTNLIVTYAVIYLLLASALFAALIKTTFILKLSKYVTAQPYSLGI